jgi:hypothetical protein
MDNQNSFYFPFDGLLWRNSSELNSLFETKPGISSSTNRLLYSSEFDVWNIYALPSKRRTMWRMKQAIILLSYLLTCCLAINSHSIDWYLDYKAIFPKCLYTCNNAFTWNNAFYTCKNAFTRWWSMSTHSNQMGNYSACTLTISQLTFIITYNEIKRNTYRRYSDVDNSQRKCVFYEICIFLWLWDIA